MPLITALLGGLLTICGSMVGRILIALGMGYVTYSGFDLAVTWLLDRIKGDINSMPADVINFLAFMWVDKAIGMIFSAYSVALTVKMAGASKITKLITKG